MPMSSRQLQDVNRVVKWNALSYLGLSALILLTITLFFVLRDRWQIWASTTRDVHYSALATQSTVSELLAQSSLSLSGIRADLENPESPFNNESLRVTRDAMRFDPMSDFLGFRDRESQRYFVMDRHGHLVNSAIGRDVAGKLPSPTTQGLDIYPLIQIPDDEDWYLPMVMPVNDSHREVDMVFALIAVRRLIQGASTLKTLEDSFLALATTRGQRLFRIGSLDLRGEVNGPPVRADLVAQWLKTRDGNYRGVSQLDHRSVILGYSVSDSYPFLVIVGVPLSSLYVRWARQSLAPAIVLLLSGTLLVLLGRRLRDTMKNLQWMLETQRHASSHDKLTGLLNRDAFISEVNQWAQAHPDSRGCVMLFNLNRFKSINDTLGQDAGDQLLLEIGHRLKASLPEEHGLLARLGADEFAVFETEEKAQTWLDTSRPNGFVSLSEPLRIQGTELEFSASLGFACFPDDGRTSDELLRCADVAMRQAKSDLQPIGRYLAARDHFSPDRLELRNQFVKALRDGALSLVYQPKIGLADGRLMGVEALARWRHPVRGPIAPLTFIPLAENSELIHAFTHFALQTALRQIKHWHKAGQEVPVAVNLSVNNLIDQGFVERLQLLLAVEQVPPRLLELEVTESAVMRHPEQVLKSLRAIRALGVKLSIDDFGTGYASLAYLKQLPVQTLKIDKTFIDNLESDEANQRIVQSAIRLAHEFGMSVVAEGVEQAVAADLLRGYGCEMAQGYYYAPPLSPDELENRWLPRRGPESPSA